MFTGKQWEPERYALHVSSLSDGAEVSLFSLTTLRKTVSHMSFFLCFASMTEPIQSLYELWVGFSRLLHNL